MIHHRSVGPRSIVLTAVAVVAAVLGAGLIIGVVITDRPAPGAAPTFGPTRTSSPPTPTPAPHRQPAAAPETGAGRPSSTPTPTPTTPEQPAGPTPTGPQRRPAALTESRPTQITIASIDVSADFVDLGVGPQGELDTPTDPADVGWFVGSRTPGGPGPSVVAGHVTWNGEPSVFFGLDALRHGDRVSVRRADGSTAVFAVTARDTFAKDAFPTERVYAPTGKPELVLITCGGDYDAEQHSYDANVIVRAKLVDHHR